MRQVKPSGVTSRSMVACEISPALLRKIARSLNSNLARKITNGLDASPNTNTYPD